MTPIKLSDQHWHKLRDFLRQVPGIYIGQETECRRFLEGVLWIGRSGAQWRLLPPAYGAWNTVYKRFARWCERGIWTQMHRYFAHDPDLESLLIDSTIIRAHPCAAGAPREKGGSRVRR